MADIVKGCEQMTRHHERNGVGRELLEELERPLPEQGKDSLPLVEQARRRPLVGGSCWLLWFCSARPVGTVTADASHPARVFSAGPVLPATVRLAARCSDA